MSLMIKKFKICHHGLKQNYAFDYNLGPHAQKCIFYYNMNDVWFQYQCHYTNMLLVEGGMGKK